MFRADVALDRLIGDVVIWIRKAGPVTAIHFKSGRTLLLGDFASGAVLTIVDTKKHQGIMS